MGHWHLVGLLLERLVPTAIALWPRVALILHMMLLWHHIGLLTMRHGHIVVVMVVVVASVLITLVVVVVATALVTSLVATLVVVVSLVVVVLLVVVGVARVVAVVLVVLLLLHVGLVRLLTVHGLIVLPWHEVRILVRWPVVAGRLEWLASHLIASSWLILAVWLHWCLVWG